RLPPLRAGHTEVDRVVTRRRQIDRTPVLEVHVQRTARRTEPADRRHHLVWRRASRDLAETEPARLSDQLLGQRAVVAAEQPAETLTCAPGVTAGMTCVHGNLPGMRS